jgi:hypothetical protein
LPYSGHHELARLKAIAGKLKLTFKWPEPQAVSFVLTGEAPPIPPWRLLYSEGALPALRRAQRDEWNASLPEYAYKTEGDPGHAPR